MNRGDTNNLQFKIKMNGAYVDGSQYEEVEVQFNKQSTTDSIKKLLTEDEIEWITDHFIVHLTQEDTFKLKDGVNEMQVRLYKDDECKGTTISWVEVGRTLSSSVIEEEE